MPDLLDRLKTALADRYAIEREIGAGGMATVHLAEDLKHGRQVAVKVLRPELAAVVGGERFLHEIQIAAKLNHPHILTLIDSGEARGFLYYVMPYVQGESLRDKLQREKQLSVEEALVITQDVAGAMAYAHAQDVIHRDLKPGNILLHEGEAMVADFGLALALRAAGGQRLTETGLSLGTPEYMSPEQATADHDVDTRSDIYSLAAVLYELLAGEPPHTGRSTQAIIAKLLTEPPTPLRILRNTVPEAVDRAVMKALAKVPADRFATVKEFEAALPAVTQQELRDVSTLDSGVAPRVADRYWRINRRSAVALIGAVLISAALGFAAVRFLRPGVPQAIAPAAIHRQLTFFGTVTHQALSPDGRSIAYLTTADEGLALSVQEIVGGPALELATMRIALSLEWSPQGSELLLGAGFESAAMFPPAYVLSRQGGVPRRVADWGWARWSPDGSQLASFMQGGLKLIRVTTLATGETSDITLPQSLQFILGADWSPIGDRLVVHTTDAKTEKLWTIGIDGTELTKVLESTTALNSPRWSAGGDAVYYILSGDPTVDLMKIRVNSDGTADGVPMTLLGGLQFGSAFGATFSLSADGSRLTYPKEVRRSNMQVISWEAGAIAETEQAQLLTGTALREHPRISPDGRWVAYSETGPSGRNLFRAPLAGGAPVEQLTFSNAVASPPAWSPDGTSIAYGARIDDVVRVQILDLRGGTTELFDRTEMQETGDIVWAAADRIVYHRRGVRNYHVLDRRTADEHELVPNDSVGWITSVRPSPGGERVAAYWNKTSGQAIWLLPLPDSAGTKSDSLHTLLGRGSDDYILGWSADGAHVFALSVGEVDVRAIAVADGRESHVVTLPFQLPLLGGPPPCHLHASSDRWSIVCAVVERTTDVWMIENFDPAVR